jgi:hypothetical protein
MQYNKNSWSAPRIDGGGGSGGMLVVAVAESPAKNVHSTIFMAADNKWLKFL